MPHNPIDPAGSRTTPAVLAIVRDAEAERAAREAATLAGARIAASIGFGEARARLSLQAAIDVILIDAIGAGGDEIDDAIDSALKAARETDARIVAVFDETQIDAVAAQLLGEDVQLLCSPSLAERVSALAVAGRGGRPALQDRGRESETARLQRLNDEVARIARTLARLTRETEPDKRGGSMRDRALAYAGPPSPDTDDAVDAASVRSLIRLRRLRGQFFEASLFADPAWDMLLDLFAARLEQDRVSVSSLCIAADVPPTTALRWIATMTEATLFERHADPRDRRRAFIMLSDDAVTGMTGYFGAAKRAGLTVG